MKKFLKSILIIIIFIITWDSIHYVFQIDSTILPSFKDIYVVTKENILSLLYNMLFTLGETLLGLFCTLIFSFIIVIIINEIPIVKAFFLRFIYLFQMIPLMAIAPLIIVWLGIGVEVKVLLIVLYSSFAIIVTTLDAFEDVSQTHKLYILSLTQNKYKLYKYLYFPMSYTQIFAGIKIAITYSVGCAITTEYLGSKHGLGILLNRAYSSYQTDLLFVIIIIIVLITISLLSVTNLVERLLRR